MQTSRDSSFSLFVLAVNLQLAYPASRSFWLSHLLPFIPPSYALGSPTGRRFPPLRSYPLLHKRQLSSHLFFFTYVTSLSQNLQTAERNKSTNFKALPRASSIYVPDLTLLRSLTRSLNGLTSACSLLAVPIPFIGGDSIPMQAYYVRWWTSSLHRR